MTTDTATEAATQRDRPPATGQSEAGAGSDPPRRGTRTRARETTGRTGRSATDRPVANRVRAWGKPPEINTTPRPPLTDVWAYLSAGEWTTPEGPLRFLGRAYGCIAYVAVAYHYWRAWLWERPSRLAAAMLLARVTWEIPLVRTVVSIVTWPLRVFFTPVL